jgi:hypothetical protein
VGETPPRLDWLERVQESDLPARAKNVAAVIFRHANWNTLEAFPGTRKIARFASLDRKTVLNAIEDLRHAGFLAVTLRPRHTTTLYRLQWGSDSTTSGGMAPASGGVAPIQWGSGSTITSKEPGREPVSKPVKEDSDATREWNFWEPWSCPHCGAENGVNEQDLGASWCVRCTRSPLEPREDTDES